MTNSVFREPAVIQSIITVFLSIYLLIRQGLPLICQQSLKTPLIYNGMAGPGLALEDTETAEITVTANYQPSLCAGGTDAER